MSYKLHVEQSSDCYGCVGHNDIDDDPDVDDDDDIVVPGAVTCLQVGEDCSLLSGGADRSVCLWRPAFR